MARHLLTQTVRPAVLSNALSGLPRALSSPLEVAIGHARAGGEASHRKDRKYRLVRCIDTRIVL